MHNYSIQNRHPGEGRDPLFNSFVGGQVDPGLRRFDEALRPLGLTNGQFSLLMSLNRPGPPTIGSVAALLAMDRTTLTAALKPLERRGLVEVRTDARDRRSRRLLLTIAGRRLLAAALPLWQREHQAVDRLLAAADPDRLRGELRVLS